MKINILLNEISKINRFVSVVNQFESDVDISKNRYLVNGKSIMGIYSLDLSEPVVVHIHSTNNEELEKFKEVMEEFRVD